MKPEVIMLERVVKALSLCPASATPMQRAYAMIEAFRDPTETMLDAGHAAFEANEENEANCMWQAMVDAALSGG